jgi:hypothetical protein
MQLQNVSHQQVRHPLYAADGSITSGGTAQIVLPVHQSRALLKLQNTSGGPLWFEFGSARATCTLSSKAVSSSFTITNSGFNFTKPPLVKFFGGGTANNSSYLGNNQYGGPAPSNPATAIAVLSGGSVSAITLTNPGANYIIAPQLVMYDDDLDPYGCATPANGVGMLLSAGSQPYILNGSSCFTDSISVWGATTGQTYLCRWMP